MPHYSYTKPAHNRPYESLKCIISLIIILFSYWFLAHYGGEYTLMAFVILGALCFFFHGLHNLFKGKNDLPFITLSPETIHFRDPNGQGTHSLKTDRVDFAFIGEEYIELSVIDNPSVYLAWYGGTSRESMCALLSTLCPNALVKLRYDLED